MKNTVTICTVLLALLSLKCTAGAEVAKRPFCGPRGCFNNLKRSESGSAVLDSPAGAKSSVQTDAQSAEAPSKRVFCNGLTGCFNGKRSEPPVAKPQKRVFCNGLTGCFNGKKRADQQEVKEKRVFCNGFTGCNGTMRKKVSAAAMEENLSKALAKAELWRTFMARLNNLRSKRPFCSAFGCGNFRRRRSLSSNNL